MDLYKTKILRRLKFKCSELQEELDYVQCIYNEAVPSFCSEVEVFCKENNIKNPLDSLDDEEKEKKKEEFTDNIKHVYREIAKKTHPDVNESSVNSLDLYRNASKAKKNNDIHEIISIAKDLKIDINNLKYSEISKIERSIENTEAKIKQITNSYPYVWFFSSDKKRPDIIAGFTLKMCNS